MDCRYYKRDGWNAITESKMDYYRITFLEMDYYYRMISRRDGSLENCEKMEGFMWRDGLVLLGGERD